MDTNKENLSSQAKLWNFIYGFAESLALKCAVQLDLANTIHNHGTPMTVSELSAHLPAQPVNHDALYRLMRYLVHMKLFTKSLVDGEIRYGLAPPAKFLVKGWDKCMVDTILAITDEDFMAPWHFLEDGLTEKTETAFEMALGKNIWKYMADYPDKNQLFNEGMANDTRLIMSALVKECRSIFENVTTLVDVGGGTGTAVKNIAKAFPKMKCTAYDLPHVIADSRSEAEVHFLGGDMFKYVPKADAVMMKCILHDWGDEECIEILKKCKDAVPKEGGKVIIIDIVLTDVMWEHPYAKARLTLDLDMMLNTGGKERTEEEWKKLIHDAGYRGYKITQISALQSVIEAYPS